MSEPLLRYPIQQHAFVVDDIDEAMARWTRTTGAGPFWLSRDHYGQQHTYRGEPWDEPLHYAFAGTGETHVQLIQQDSATPSVYRDMFAPGEEGFHHVAMLVPEAEHAAEVERFEKAGFAVASTLWSYVNVAYIDCRDEIGCFVELHGANQKIYDLFELFRTSHAEWDGVTDPVRVRSTTSSGPRPSGR
ncbi:VOC family protein [Jatrophihabitans fulvus]